ncbi:unnamed protein product [Adineta steineri]|uniref:Protein kinase domain-containing protein n=1 Tax=Adineta steineri TaxID=433720 RepID=A0A813TUA9_9BILA|nr:unnamed protein product [Adineta steineri]
MFSDMIPFDNEHGNWKKQTQYIVNTFSDDGECIEFIQTINNNKVCMIVSESLGYRVVPHVHDMSQVDTIFIFCNNQEWVKEWPKIKGVFTDITSICEALKQAAHQCEQNAISISIVAPNKKLDQLDPSFMYTQILNEILLTISFEDKHFQEFITYCRGVYEDDEHELKNINQLQATYKNNIPIWWYTWDAFLYRMLNQALRTTDVDIIVRMGFFIKDLHCDIQRLHSEQFDGHQSGETLILYRGQGLSKEDFTEMTNTKGELLSFNSFLATSKNRNISLNFAQQAATNPDLVGILFVISINPSGSTTPFASVSDVSYFHTEEVLFSMHTIFRIGDIKPIDGNSDLYEANLILTSDNDQDLRTLNDQIRQETFPDEEGWYRLGELLIKTGQSNKAQEVYEVLLHQKTDESDEACIYTQLGSIKYNQEEYPEALTYFEKTLAINQKTLPSNHPHLGASYNNIGNVYDSMGDYPKALSSHEKVLAIRQQSLPSNHADLARLNRIPSDEGWLQNQTFHVKGQSVTLYDRIGNGKFGSVWSGGTRDGQQVAVKIYDFGRSKDHINSTQRLDSFKTEIRMGYKMRHEVNNAVTVFGFDLDRQRHLGLLVMELGEESLTERVKNLHTMHSGSEAEGYDYITATARKNIWIQLVNIAVALKRNNIVHRDMKPANLVYFGSTLKIVDFGIALDEYSGQDGHRRLGGTHPFTAPECFSGAVPVTPRAEVWSVGAILYYLTYGQAPIYETAQPIPGTTKTRSSLVKDILHNCFQRNPWRRPDHYWLLNHPLTKSTALI